MGIATSLMLSWTNFIIAGPISVPILVGYSIWLKRQPLSGNLAVSFMTGMAFIYVGAAFGRIADTLVMAALAFGFSIIREIVKDLEDMEGDGVDQARTLPLVWGETRTRTLVMILMLVFMGLDILPYTLGIYNQTYLLLVLFGINLPMVLAALMIWMQPGRPTYARVQLFLKLDIFVGLAALYFGNVH